MPHTNSQNSKLNKPTANISLDLDNKWSYMKTHGEPGWEKLPSYLDILVPRVLEFLAERELTITFFVVGQDATVAENYAALQAIANAGHEIGNHSFKHEQWIRYFSEEQIHADFLQTEEAIEGVTGQQPVGFRGPGYSCSTAILEVLAQRGYLYDASTFPTIVGPLARRYYFMTAKLTPEEKEDRRKLFGTFSDVFRPNKPYQWKLEAGSLLEVPVTNIPLFRVPFHVSYILYLSRFSSVLALTYFKFALAMCRLTNTPVSLLLHPLDFLDGRLVPELSFFPAMHVPASKKIEIVGKMLDLLASHYLPVTMQQHTREIKQQHGSLLIEPNFSDR